jgi:hypothetical protein
MQRADRNLWRNSHHVPRSRVRIKQALGRARTQRQRNKVFEVAKWRPFQLIMHWSLYIYIYLFIYASYIYIYIYLFIYASYEIRKRKANWIGHILRRNCLLKQVIEGEIKGDMEVTRRRGRRRKKRLDDLKEGRGYSHLKEEALYRTMWRNRFRGGFGPVVRQNTEWMNEWMHHIQNCNINVASFTSQT